MKNIGIKLAGGALAASLLLLGTGMAFAQTYTNGSGTSSANTSTTSGGTSGTPNAPNTGAGGSAAANIMFLATAGVLAISSGLYLARRSTSTA